MKQTNPNPTFLERALAAWDRFWFTPTDPTLLGLIRICAGLIITYTLFAYTFYFDQYMGKDGWYSLDLRQRVAHDRPNTVGPLSGRPWVFPAKPDNEEERRYAELYFDEFKEAPLTPFPEDQAQADFSIRFRKKYKVDARALGLRLPRTEAERKYVEDYTAKWNRPPPPPYPKSEEEAREIDAYLDRVGGQTDPRQLYARGTPIWSLWFHITDPTAMMIVHLLIVLVAALFTLGFCTRITAVLTWAGQICYIHRTPVIMFGADTMTTVLLLYMVIGSSGGALSLDRLIAGWWSQSKGKIVARWKAFWGETIDPASVPPFEYSPTPVPTVSTGVAMRLLQIHVCIIYVAAGLSKLQGAAWWNGLAVWGTVANYEFAPMDWPIYNDLLMLLGRNQLVFDAVFTSACMFTLAFEIGYAFLVWRPATRWVVLSMAILLHGFIGLFMGLKTFSLIMLVMNMVFLTPGETRWLLKKFTWMTGWGSKSEPKPVKVAAGATP